MTKQNLDRYVSLAGVHYPILSLILTMLCLFVRAKPREPKEQPGCIADIRNPWAYMVGSPTHGHVRVKRSLLHQRSVKALGASMLDTQNDPILCNQMSLEDADYASCLQNICAAPSIALLKLSRRNAHPLQYIYPIERENLATTPRKRGAFAIVTRVIGVFKADI